MATTMILPIRRAAKDVIEVLLTHYAKAVEHFVQSAVGFAVHGETQILRVQMWMKTKKCRSTIPLSFRLLAKSHCHSVSA
jgi:hypothetical protein